MGRGAWWAVVHGVAKSWTGLSDQHFSPQMEGAGFVGGNNSYPVSVLILNQFETGDIRI